MIPSVLALFFTVFFEIVGIVSGKLHFVLKYIAACKRPQSSLQLMSLLKNYMQKPVILDAIHLFYWKTMTILMLILKSFLSDIPAHTKRCKGPPYDRRGTHT